MVHSLSNYPSCPCRHVAPSAGLRHPLLAVGRTVALHFGSSLPNPQTRQISPIGATVGFANVAMLVSVVPAKAATSAQTWSGTTPLPAATPRWHLDLAGPTRCTDSSPSTAVPPDAR